MKNIKKPKKRPIRIIGGKLKKRKIFTIKNKSLRPTTNYIKETLFNWISNHKIKKINCLDCFSGSGSLGIEAYSRFNASITFLEINKEIIKKLKKNIKNLKILKTKIIHTNTLKWLKKKKNSYNLVFVDPPFHSKIIEKVIFLLEKKEWLQEKTLIYIEKPNNKKKNIIPKNWNLYKKKKTKKIEYSLYLRKKLPKKFKNLKKI